ncbi:hypothetical protein HN51_070140 [Arachis hypogaea]
MWYGGEADALLNYMREGDVRRKKPEAAQVVDNKVFGDEDLFVMYWVFGFGFQLSLLCCFTFVIASY